MSATTEPQHPQHPSQDDPRDADRRTAPLRWGAAGFLGGAAVVGLAWSIATRSDAPPLPIPRVGDAPAMTLAPVPNASTRAALHTGAPSAVPPANLDLREQPAPAALTESASALATSTAAPPATPPAQSPAAAPPPPAPAAQNDPPAPTTPGLLDLNSATVEELELLPGIGPALAQRIVDDRARRGKFLSVRDLDRVPGIGEKTIERLRPYVAVR